jgi:hypothetical protein
MGLGVWLGGRAGGIRGLMSSGSVGAGNLKNIHHLGKGGIDEDFPLNIDGWDDLFAICKTEHGFEIRFVLLNISFFKGYISFT